MLTVLLVEDTPDNREIYRTILEYGGHRVLEAVNGLEALRLVPVQRPDVIVMDVTMPVMDGIEATRRLKSDPLTSGIPVLILTAHAFASDVAAAKEAGADAYMAKPCEPRTLLVAVERLASGLRDPIPPGDRLLTRNDFRD